MYTTEQLERMQSVDVTAVDKSALVDIRGIHPEAASSYAERARQFFEQVKNPYAFRVGDVAVKLDFSHGTRSLHDAMASYLAAIKRNA